MSIMFTRILNSYIKKWDIIVQKEIVIRITKPDIDYVVASRNYSKYKKGTIDNDSEKMNKTHNKVYLHY